MTKQNLRNIIQQILKESSDIGTLSGGNNSARWTAPGQQRHVKIEQLSGYSQIDFPIADTLDISNEKHQWAGISQSKKFHNKVRATRQSDGTLKLENKMKKSELRQIIREEIQHIIESRKSMDVTAAVVRLDTQLKNSKVKGQGDKVVVDIQSDNKKESAKAKQIMSRSFKQFEFDSKKSTEDKLYFKHKE